MKLLNRSLLYLSFAFLLIIGIWSVLFYVNLKDEIRDSIDDGLDNNRLLILQKVTTDSTLLFQDDFGGNNFVIHPVLKQKAFTLKDIYKDTLMFRLNEDDLEPVRILHTAFEHENKYYRLKIISSLVEEDDLIEESFWNVFWLFIVLITSIIIVNNVILRKIWHPFYDILNHLITYRLDTDEVTFKIATKTKEFIQLQEASTALIKHSKETYVAQKQFTENASHELQTPIAIIIAKLELLLESENLVEKDANTIAAVIRISDRLKNLNKTLLLLTKIENRQFIEQKIIHLNEKVIEIQSNFQEFADFKNIIISCQEKADVKVVMNISLFEILLSNLLKNAIFHNVNDGEIAVQITPKEFIICNTGKELDFDAKTIFNRFVKNQANSQSTGLGLAVCHSICKLYTIDLSYEFIKNQHCFKINFENIRVNS
ncbi:signal transduction histidine kinase [Flavobacterium sp. PL11]|uniref:sensor histidine kinase n=1 Tax=Flavobacterium sp. PL11 TaxID=3071717 RepID=UPI002E0CC7DD|nr:signal transduction histidine kinase [Flavobacterium sp. PL11]